MYSPMSRNGGSQNGADRTTSRSSTDPAADVPPSVLTVSSFDQRRLSTVSGLRIVRKWGPNCSVGRADQAFGGRSGVVVLKEPAERAADVGLDTRRDGQSVLDRRWLVVRRVEVV